MNDARIHESESKLGPLLKSALLLNDILQWGRRSVVTVCHIYLWHVHIYIYINPSFSLNVVGTTQPQYEVKLCFSAGRSDRIASYGWISGTSLASQQVSCLRLFLISLKDSWEPTNKWELWLLNSLVVYNLYCWPISHRNYILINNT